MFVWGDVVQPCSAGLARFSVAQPGSALIPSVVDQLDRRFLTLAPPVSYLLPSRQFGYIVLTTSYGIMDHEEARKKNTGGKILGYFVCRDDLVAPPAVTHRPPPRRLFCVTWPVCGGGV